MRPNEILVGNVKIQIDKLSTNLKHLIRSSFHYLPPFKASWSNNSSTNDSNEYDDQWNTHPSEEEYLTSNQQIIETIISQQIRNGFSPDKIFIGGFYRGASLALLVGLNSSLPLGGIICISPPIPFIKKFEKLTPIHQTQLKVFWSHGIKDLFDSTLQKISRSVEFFQDHSAPILIDFKTYPAQSPSPQEMNDLLHWILPLTK
ncbi:hypothetical protein O181_067343 [Austropuccinia psidii MF-1]|uniref:Acyl-protein thioesterase 1 n=1 Tax=Austropuccinia psidii MF-1 TaxID=1389203 RepID=A0A9Q3ET66_9BASI|nr:hypothetical protein [Austropuccinia psidii MF-1]